MKNPGTLKFAQSQKMTIKYAFKINDVWTKTKNKEA